MMTVETEVARHDERLNNLEDWQRSQNGQLKTLAGKIDRVHMWLIGVLGSTVVSLILLVINLAVMRGLPR